jgi:hypothetical protein
VVPISAFPWKPGRALGALCLIDHGPRRSDAAKVKRLQDVARIAMDEVVLEITCHRQAEVEASGREAEDRFIGSVVRHSLRTSRRRQGPWRGGFKRW